MSIELALFYFFAVVLVAAALAVVTVRNPVHAALFLVLTFFTSACIWLLAEAEFLAIALVLVYVGAVMVLFLFVVMMLDIKVAPLREGFARYLPVGVLVGAVMLTEMLLLMGMSERHAQTMPPEPAAAAGLSNIEWLGQALFTQYLLPFEIAGLILTVAIVAAVTLTLRRRHNPRTQKPSDQVKVRSTDRVRLVKMAPETPRS